MEKTSGIAGYLRDTFELSHANQGTILSMEGLRGLAVFLVFLVHYGTLMSPWLPEGSISWHLNTAFREIGHIGVDLFFVLSGYLIYGSLIKRPTQWNSYFRKRVRRIHPTFLVILAIYIALSLAMPEQSKLSGVLWADLGLIAQNILLLPGLFDVPAIVTVSWSLSYEFFYYILIPIIIAGLSLRQWHVSKRIALFLGLSIVGFSYFALNGGHIRLLMFVSGILLFEVLHGLQRKSHSGVGLPALFLAIASVIVVDALSAPKWTVYLLLFVLFFILCFDCFSRQGLANKVFCFTPLRWFGNMSYSYYLAHSLGLHGAMIMLNTLTGAPQPNALVYWAYLPLAFTATIFVSGVFFIFVEKPFSLTAPKKPVAKTA